MNTKLLNPGKLIPKIAAYFKSTPDKGNTEKPMREILNKECVMQRYKKINLDIFTKGIHCVAKAISVYYRLATREYIIILDTSSGRLVERELDSFHANEEFTFICEEDKVVSEGKDVNINLFHYTMYDNDLNKIAAAA
jgi:hypothetical protein